MSVPETMHDFLFTDRYDLWDLATGIAVGFCLGLAYAAMLASHVRKKTS